MTKIIAILTIAILLSGLTLNTSQAAQVSNSMKAQPQKVGQAHAKMKREFEQRLNLSDKQKEKTKALHKQGREEMKPIIYKLELDRQEIEQVKQSSMPEKNKQEKINSINEDIRKLQKQATEVSKKNSQEFEKILNKKQKEELAKMKAEGRARFEKNHPARPMFGGIGTSGFMMMRPFGIQPAKDSK